MNTVNEFNAAELCSTKLIEIVNNAITAESSDCELQKAIAELRSRRVRL